MVVTYSTGELHIRNARMEDGIARYSCMTLHSLTQERKRSVPAVLTVTGMFRFLLIVKFNESSLHRTVNFVNIQAASL